MTTAQAEPLTRYIRQVAATHLAADLSDRQLLERYAGRRDEAAFTALVRRHGPLVLGVCRRVLRDAHAAEDAFQATFLVLARKAGAVGRPEALGPWLHGVAARVALKARGREVRRREAEGRAAALVPTTASPEETVWRDLRPLLDEAIGTLPDKLRTPFVLHYLEGRTVSAVARHLGCPRGTVATHLARARQRLRARLMRRGLTLSAAALGAALSRQVAAAVLTPALPGILLRTATGFAVGETAAGAVPAGIAALAQGGLQTMSLSKQVVIAVALLLTVGTVGGTVLLAQGPATKEAAGAPQTATPAPAAKETDLALFREGGKLFLAEDYRGADRTLSELLERYPESPLAATTRYLAIIAKNILAGENNLGRSRKAEARRIINAALAGASAAEAGQGKGQSTPAERTRQKVNELMREYNALYNAGKYKEAEMHAAAAHELNPENPIVGAAVQIARAQRRRREALEKGSSQVPDPNLPRETEQPGKPPNFTSDLSRPLTTKGEKEKEIEKLLQRPVNLSFQDTPLSQVVDDLRSGHGLNIVIDQTALREERVSLTTPVTIRLEGVALKSALNLLLHSVHLTYTVRDGVLVLTSPTAARGRLVTATYKVADLAGGDPKADALIHLIVRAVEPASWEERGGSGTIDYFPLGAALVVKQTPDVQEQIADFLAALRRLKGGEKKEP